MKRPLFTDPLFNEKKQKHKGNVTDSICTVENTLNATAESACVLNIVVSKVTPGLQSIDFYSQ